MAIDNLFFSRRRLLTATALAPLLWYGRPLLAATPGMPRVAALEWLPVELLVALGVTPFAVADIANYRLWVNDPPLPATTIDVGLRTEPNLELLAQLQPSMLVWSAGYGPSEAMLSRIAPGLGVAFTDGKAPLTMARHSLQQLAARLGREQAAQAHLAEFDRFLEQMKARLAGRIQRPVLLMSLLDSRHALVLGHNSLFQPVLDKLGVVNAWQGNTNFWGSEIVGFEQLAAIQDADVLCFEHGDKAVMREVAATPLWQSMPFIRQQRFQRVPAVWLYGATLSAMRFCRILVQTLGGTR